MSSLLATYLVVSMSCCSCDKVFGATVRKCFWNILKYFEIFLFFLFLINMFLILSYYFDVLMSKIIF
jgi:hypothetical protein